jgi:hypothetical protein
MSAGSTALVTTLWLLAVATGCTSTCDNAGVTVDAQGNIVVRGESAMYVLENTAYHPNLVYRIDLQRSSPSGC